MKDHKEQMKPLQAVIFFGTIFVVGVILYAVSVKMQPEKTDLYYENIGRMPQSYRKDSHPADSVI